MNALISASDIKMLSTASAGFQRRFGYIAVLGLIRLSAINPTNSAFCMFAFDPDFFLNVEAEAKIECQIQLKTILSILRTRGRNVERLQLTLSDNSCDCRFSITLHCHYGITKAHRLTYSPKRGLLPTADPNPPNFFCINPATASEWLDHFLSSSRTGEITLMCTPDSCIARSKEEEIPENRNQIRKAIQTEVKIAVQEFKEYCVLEDTKLTFSLREFKATVGLAETLGTAVEVNFSDGDEPLFVRLRVENVVRGEFVIATTKGDRTAGGGGGVDEAGAGVDGSTGGTGGNGGRASAQSQSRPQPQPQEQVEIAASAATSFRTSAQASNSAAASRNTTTISNNRKAQDSSSCSSSLHLPHSSAPRAVTKSSSSHQHGDAIPFESTPFQPRDHQTSRPSPDHLACQAGESEDETTQPLFFPGGEASELSLQAPTQSSPPSQLSEVTFVQPTPVAQGGDPTEFFGTLTSSTQSTTGQHMHEQIQEIHTKRRKRTSQMESYSHNTYNNNNNNNNNDDDDDDNDDNDDDDASDNRNSPGPRKRFKPLF
ncbi:related to DNA repair protein rad9 [Melanopsichium pennsylvanicum]|uniref:Related to DNA repair protein rad9 n=1 Tax=Melanopsichium pennsylvanicum TaxID=63383 RepID=A0AAJ4XRI7_9BASI|nr:related to DNA repair protein rad9 [Melanopsichium pennsylvanicum]